MLTTPYIFVLNIVPKERFLTNYLLQSQTYELLYYYISHEKSIACITVASELACNVDDRYTVVNLQNQGIELNKES